MLRGLYGYIQTKQILGPEIDISVFDSFDLGKTNTVVCPAILDTGAAMTCIPSAVINALIRTGLTQLSSIEVRGAVAESSRRPTYKVGIQINKLAFDLRVISLDRSYAIIGRDLLNTYEVSFAGPQRQWRFMQYDKINP